ncbi:class I SAM-dependent DNA methyltransferase [Pararhodobacter zhoushanensis]|uniref:Class I SAM-dependent methyltransferase n=1 Tax=Pararhodobacter zhoushanensis TaxID=2479545 RepID=A0ABT3H0P2_9RHOB|nr:class I SAM-dependent methyltransferase [Pararhodobacter zhoushanensis]MCW1933283.1 class I SAM-dependent methyltransferase [Pararhodobacter zhoushanensis]
MQPPDLSNAYALNGAEDCQRLYADWAQSYDTDFAAGMDYRLPAETAAAFLRAGPLAGPVLDVGAGTGLLAAALRAMGHEGAIDALDLSDAMLAQAGSKGLYRRLTKADVTQPLPMSGYTGIVSSGTFTHGHVGPEALPNLIAAALPGAVFALSINAAVWDDLGFDPAFRALGTITDLDRSEVAIYGQAAQARDPAHATDTALIVTFRKS